jgi:hypothetical protein
MIEGKVAVHRWFAGGEDWAYHPWFAGHGRELLAVLDRRLKSHEEGEFRIEALGGVLVGESRPDRACPDPKARDRRPSVLRVAFVPQPLTEEESEAVLGTLDNLPLPERPGEYDALVVPVDAPPRPASLQVRTDGIPAAPRRRRILPLLAVVMGAVLGTAVYLATRARSPEGEQARTSSPTTEERPPAARRVADPAAQDWERYRGLQHPYLDFLHDLRKATGGPLVYEDWLEGHRHLRFPDRDKPLPESLRRQVDEARRPVPAFKEAARQMAALLRQWSGKTEPAERAADWPFPVIDQFFRYLVRPGTLPRPWEADHPANVFLWRLPRDPIAEGRTFDTEEELKLPLCVLLRDLEGNPAAPLHTTWSTKEILEHIGQEMDYREWLARAQAAGRRFALRADEDPGPEVREALARFQGRAGERGASAP